MQPNALQNCFTRRRGEFVRRPNARYKLDRHVVTGVNEGNCQAREGRRVEGFGERHGCRDTPENVACQRARNGRCKFSLAQEGLAMQLKTLYVCVMPRRPNTRPTNIYWLFDVRPETIASGWPKGKPFYCGKTVCSTLVRLGQHHHNALRKPHGLVGPRILECSQFIRVQTMEVVSPGEDWCAREKYWISTGRLLYPGCFLNVADGGQGTVGYIPSVEHIAKVTATKIGRKHSPERCAKIADANRGKKRSPEICARMGRPRGLKHSLETRKKMRVAQWGKKSSPEARANMSAAAKRRHTREATHGG